MTIAEYPLPNGCLSYIEAELLLGLSLSKQFQQIALLQEFQFSTYLPVGIPLENVVDYSTGGNYGMDSIYYSTAERLKMYLQQHQDMIVVLEEPIPAPRLKPQPKQFQYQDEVYYWANSDDATAQIMNLLFEVSNYPGLVFVCRQIQQLVNYGHALTLSELQDLAQSTEIILVNAYDVEGWIMGCR